MKKSSLVKISFAMLVILIYTFVFGVMNIVAEVPPASEAAMALGHGGFPEEDSQLLPVFCPIDYIGSQPEAQATVAADPADSEEEDTPEDVTEPPATEATTNPVTVVQTDSEPTQPEATHFEAETAAETPHTPAPAPVNNSNAPNPPSDQRLQIRNLSGTLIEGDAFDIVTRVVEAEIGCPISGSSFHREAIKAQAIAAYTYIKRHNLRGSIPNLPILQSASEQVIRYTRAVWGTAIYHNGELIQAFFSASSAGWTASPRNVWGMDVPYLQSRRTAFDDRHDPNFGRTATFTSAQIRQNVQNQTGISLSGDPADWLRIINHTDTAYVGQMSIGGRTTFESGGRTVTINGRIFRERIMGFNLRSASFSFVYDSNSDSFIFTTSGFGHGVGMSQNGANILATHYGYSYRDILQFYYTGVTIQ